MDKIYLDFFLSFFCDRIIEQTGSPLNPELKVFLSNGRYKLVTGHAVYSYDDRYTNFLDAFRELKKELTRVNTCLVLGLGLGSIPLMLERKIGIKVNCTAVELDPEIIRLYKKYTAPRLKNEVRLIAGDAREFLENKRERFDLICMDVFEDAKVPQEFSSMEFCNSLREHLNEGGILIYNRLEENEQDHRDNNHFFEHNFRPVFPDSRVLKLEANRMYLALKGHAL